MSSWPVGDVLDPLLGVRAQALEDELGDREIGHLVPGADVVDGRSSGRTAASGRMGVTSAVSMAWIARQWSSTWRPRRHSGNGLEKQLK